MKMVHKITESKNINETQNIIPTEPNANIPEPNANIPEPNANISKKCDSCNKSFSTKSSLTRHINKNRCKGIKNSLECDICHNIFSFSSALARHRKSCINKQLIVVNNTSESDNKVSETTINDNSVNITNNITNNNNTINNNNVTQQYIVFNIYDSDPIEFKHDHLDNAEVLNQIFDKDTFTEAFQDYSYRIFDAQENRALRKTNMRQNTSLVYDHSKTRWREILDNMIYYKFARGISSSALVLTDKNDVTIDKDYRDTLQQIQIDCEVSPDSANKDEQMRYSKETKNSINMLKAVVKDITKDTTT